MSNRKYNTEREGQIEFFDQFHIDYQNNEVLIDNTDGVWNGNLLEFKLNINNLNSVLFQAIKYLSKMRIKGESVPANIILVSLNSATAYIFKSENYRSDIQKVYIGASSKNNTGFSAEEPEEELKYFDVSADTIRLQVILKQTNYMPVDLNEDCILGWAERYYRENPKASKADFIGDETGVKNNRKGEIREPVHFKGLINPYKEKSNSKFMYLMDTLNDRLKKKDLGAFYTPIPYCKKAAELVRMAIERVPAGNDYVIIDRCAGTGNLESVLTDEELSHCILSTYEYYEYKVLQERLGDKVRFIVPPTEAQVEYDSGCIKNADAMSKEFIDNPEIKKFVDNPECTIILYENPPYSDSSAITFIEDGDNSKRAKTSKTDKFVVNEFKDKALPNLNEQRGAARESSNLFIWSGFEYYLKKPTDSYVVLSPLKYFKNVGLPKKEMIKGFAFNRKYFHATDSVISCVLWSNVSNTNLVEWDLDVYDINNDCEVIECEAQPVLNIKLSHGSVADFNDRRSFADDIDSNVICNSDGTPLMGWSHKTKTAIYNDNIIAYMAANGYTADAKHRYLMRCGYKTGIEQSFGFMVRQDNYLQKLPMWVSKMYPQDAWYEKDVYNNTSDGGDAYTKDKNFLKSCLIYTCLSNQNKCLSFDGSDGRRYQNELCFDNSRNEVPIALKDLKTMTLDKEEKQLMKQWEKVLQEAKQTANYNSEFNYGVYQITKELNTHHSEGTGKQKREMYDYPDLNGDLDTLRTMLKTYYKSHITEKMFKYELLK